MLDDLYLPSRCNQHWQYSGMDSPEHCLDKTHFAQYPFAVDYRYNSRGFRDQEWPNSVEELQQAIWCLGDSFTVGLGQPFEHIWPQVLSRKLNRRTINVSMDGASNDWIFRRAWDIINAVQPRYLVVMWSYTHRSEKTNDQLNDEDRRVRSTTNSHEQDDLHWVNLSRNLFSNQCNIIQTAIPKFKFIKCITQVEQTWTDVSDTSWGKCPQTLTELQNLEPHILAELKTLHGCYDTMLTELTIADHIKKNHVITIEKQLDFARDFFHFDILTSQWVVDQILPRFV